MNFFNFILILFLNGVYSTNTPSDSVNINSCPAISYTVEFALEERILEELVHSKELLISKLELFDSLGLAQNMLPPKNKNYKLISKQLKLLKEDISFTKIKIKLLHYMLSQARSIPYVDDRTAREVSKKLNEQLRKLKNNVLPDYDKKAVNLSSDYQAVETDVYSRNLSSPCTIRINEKDQLIANEFTLLYSHTDPKLASHFPGNEFMNCFARFIKSNKNIFLELKLVYNTPKAKQFLGRIDAGQATRIRFINGSFIYLDLFAIDEGIISPDKMQTSYSFQYKLDREDINGLENNETDAIDLIWTSGAEKLEILYFDVLKNLLKCIQEKN